MKNCIVIKGARTRNLKNINISIPINKITAIVGLSGSGKSSLVFYTLYAESYLRYLESISPYVRQFLEKVEEPDVDTIENLPPAIAFRPRRNPKNPRSIVATASGIYDYIRILYSKISALYCPTCGRLVKKYSIDEIVHEIIQLPELNIQVCFQYSGNISFLINRGYYFTIENGQKRSIDSSFSKQHIYVLVDEFKNCKQHKGRLFEALDISLSLGNNIVYIFTNNKCWRFPVYFLCQECNMHFENPEESLFSFNSPKGACNACNGFGYISNDICKKYSYFTICSEETDLLNFSKEKSKENFSIHLQSSRDHYSLDLKCTVCKGTRLNKLALSFRLEGKNTADVLQLTTKEALDFFEKLYKSHSKKKALQNVFRELLLRLKYLVENHLSYIQLNRPTFTLSNGELQRINLAYIFGSTLSDSLILIDHPSVDLHPQDIACLTKFLKNLQNKGNTILIIENNPDVISFSSTVIELGPGVGSAGGEVVFKGKPQRYLKGFYESSILNIAKKSNLVLEKSFFHIKNAMSNNLKNLQFDLPFDSLNVIVGISGAGKSSLLYNELYLKGNFKSDFEEVMFFESKIDPLRSNSHIAGFLGLFERIRILFSELKSSRNLGYSASHFSFHSSIGGCLECKGKGYKEISMQFLPPAKTICFSCDGKGFRPEILRIKYKDRNIYEILQMNIHDFVKFIGTELGNSTDILIDICQHGLGYLLLGQRLQALSIGEYQKLKLVKFFNTKKDNCLFLLDEPSFGLSENEVGFILELFRKTIRKGNTIVSAEHNLQIIANADYIVELGPAGGEKGGYLIAKGEIQEIVKNDNSMIASFLSKHYLTT